MDHVVYLDSKAKELKNILDNSKTMIIRGAAGRKMPYARVFDGDKLYFIENNANGLIKAMANVRSVINSDKMTKEQSIDLVNKYQSKLKLTNTQMKRWGGKRYIVLIELEDIKELEEFQIDRSDYGNMDDWLPVEDISKIKN